MRINSKGIVLGIYFVLISVMVIGFPTKQVVASPTVKEGFNAVEGVHYKRLHYQDKGIANAVRVLEVNVNDPHTNIKIGHPPVLNTLERTTALALRYHRKDHYIVGAVNASFYEFKQPMYLVSEDNRLILGGVIPTGADNYVSKPIAFGINQQGEGIIDDYSLALKYIHNDKEYVVTSTNKQRTANSTIVYTSDFPSNYTDTNEFGSEFIVEMPTTPTFEFGSIQTGKVTSIRPYGDKTKTKIPKNGFVVSSNGSKLDGFTNIGVGDSITFSINIDEKWQGSSAMLGSGPMLVKDGKVELSMNPNSVRAREVTARTAVAIDKSGKKVFLVTVDGKNPGYSNGMNLTTFAEHLVKLGADRAINLDGGGSTTMAVRYPGRDSVQLTNTPSDGRERGVSTILMAVSTAPKAPKETYTDIKLGDSHYEGVQYLTDKGISGYEDGTFGVGNKLTRPHTAVMFSKALELSLPSKASVVDYYTDVKASHPYAEFIAAMGAEGIFKGSNGKYLPLEELTREQMASTLVNAYGLKSNGNSVKVNLENVSNTHKENVQILADLGITNQVKDFRPSEIVTRGQFATFLFKAK